MRRCLRLLAARALTIAALAAILNFAAAPAYASRMIFLDTHSDGSFTALRCGDGDMHGDFLISWDAATNTYTFFDLLPQESASVCAKTKSFEQVL
jgi:hypothetical protein